MPPRPSSATLVNPSNQLLPLRHHTTHRSFTTSQPCRRNGAVPVFYPTTSEALSSHLENLRSRLFLPAHLKKPQQNLIYRTRYHAMLKSEPFEVEVGPPENSEVFTLAPIDRTKDVPDGWRSLRDALKLMGDAARNIQIPGRHGDPDVGMSEFHNLVPLLTGLRTSGRRLKTWQWEVVARAAGEANAANALVAAARQAEKTGLYLYDVAVVREIMWACRTYAARHGWSVRGCEKAMSYIAEISRLMEDPVQIKARRKAVHRGDITGDVRVERQADVIGVAVEIAAKRVEALRREGGSDGVVAGAKDILNIYLNRLSPNMETTIDEEKKAIEEGKPVAAAVDYELVRWVPVLNGLVTAAQAGVDHSALASVDQLRKRLERLRSAARENFGLKGEEKRRGLIWANSVL